VVAEIGKKFGPRIFTRSEEDRIGVKGGLLRERRHMQPTQGDVDPAGPVVIREAIGPLSRCDIDLYGDQIGLIIPIQDLDMLVLNRDVVPVVQVRGQRRETKRRKQGVFDRPPVRAGGLGPMPVRSSSPS